MEQFNAHFRFQMYQHVIFHAFHLPCKLGPELNKLSEKCKSRLHGTSIAVDIFGRVGQTKAKIYGILI
jgi:hypothetical protein